MKNTIFFIVAILIATNIIAQDRGINYKAVISNNGAVLQNQAVEVLFTILNNGVTVEYQETHTTTTDDSGIIILNIGEGTAVSGLFNSIKWYAPQYLKVEIDTGSGYEDFGTSELKTVPYAIYAENGNGAKILGELADVNSDITSLYLGKESGGAETDSNLNNTAVGHFSLKNNLDGMANNAFGTFSLYLNTTGRYNTSIGYQSLKDNKTGNENTALGHNAGSRSTGSGNVFLGSYAGLNETGSNKLYIENTNSSTPLIGGDFSTDEVTINGALVIKDGTEGLNKVLTSDASGKASWQNSSASVAELNDLSDVVYDGQSLYIGFEAGINDDNSNYNTAIGRQTMINTTSGRQNVSVGAQVLLLNETGSYNVALGEGALYYNISGNKNIAIGEKSGFNTLGDGNVFIGNQSGLNETGSNKLYIENSDSSTPLIAGDFSTDDVIINGALEITGNVKGKLKSEFSGDADMKAYLFGSIGTDGVTLSTSSSDGFTSSKIATGHYTVSSTGLNYYTVTATMRYGFIGFVTVEKFADSFHIKTYDTSGIAEDRGFDFIVFKR